MLLEQKWKPNRTAHALERRLDGKWAVLHNGRTVGYRDTTTTVNALTLFLADPDTLEILRFLLAAPAHQHPKMAKEIEELLTFLVMTQGVKV